MKAMDILVFKTNLLSEEDVKTIEPILDKNPGVIEWNVDREDIDKVLRIETRVLSPLQLIDILKEAGYFCEELPD